MSGFNSSLMELTPVKVYWTPAGSTAEAYLGGTLGNVKISVATEKAEIKADQTGTTPLDRRISGHKFMVTTEIAQINDFTISSYIFPSASAIGSPASGIEWFNNVGHSDISVAGQLRLHPMSQPDATKTYDWNFFVAAPTENSEVTFGPTEQSKFKVEWAIYPDQARIDGASGGNSKFAFMRFGDITL